MEQIPHKTLIIRFSSAGDIVLSSLLTRVLRKRFPACRIDYLVKTEYADLVRHDPNISQVIEFPAAGTFRDLAALRRSIRAAGYDLLIDIHDSLRSRYLCFGGPPVARINKRKFARFMLVRLKVDLYDVMGGSPSVALRYLEPLRRYGVVDDGLGLELHISDDASRAAEARLADAGLSGIPIIGVCPSARHATKMWPADRFGEAAALLAGDNAAAVVILGSADERTSCSKVEHAVRAASPATRVLNLAGALSLGEAAAILDHCAIVLCNDTGLMHIAAARRRKVVAVFGSTVRQFGFFPFGTPAEVVQNTALRCRPCTHVGLPACPKGHFKCMHAIGVDQVLAAARRLLAA